MATTTLKTRVQFKMDTYENWITNDPILLEAEIALATVSTAQDGEVNTVPAVLAKVGDGTHKFSELGWMYSKSSDVYPWAKSANPPTVNASDVVGLDAYIAGEIEDTDTQYQIVKVDDYTYKLQSKALDAADWTDVTDSTIVIPTYDDTDLAGRVTTVEESIATLTGDDQTTGSVAKAIADAIAALDLANTYEAKGAAATVKGEIEAVIGAVEEGKTVVEMIEDAKITSTYDDTALSDRVTAVEGEMGTLVGTDTGKSVRTIANEELAAQLIPADAQESLNTLEEIAAWIQDHPDDAAAMNAAIAALQTKTELGVDDGGTEYATVKLYVEAAIAALAIGDYAKAADLTAMGARVEALEAKAHEHTNADVLDAIDDAKVAEWDAKADDADLAAIAKSGNVNDLVQTDGDYIIFKCGSSSELI